MKYLVRGGNKLKGKIKISGNKNSVLPCIAACLLTDQEVVLKNVPNIRDVEVMLEIIQALGAKVSRQDNIVQIQTEKILTTQLPQELTSKLRGSVLLAGSLLGREGKVAFYHPGGDVIGKRAIEQHLEGFNKLGFESHFSNKQYQIKRVSKNSKDSFIFLELPTVTGTENLILGAVLAKGQTTIRNAAQEPHVVDLCQMLNKMGADIKGVGTNTLKITGVEKLTSTEFSIGPDPIEFGTYLIAAALTKGEIELENCQGLDAEPITWPLQKMGLKIEPTSGGFKASASSLQAISTNFPLTANFWPGFPTDLISVMIVLATQAKGISLIRDYLYESRLYFVDKLIAMGAGIIIADPHRVLVYGPSQLIGRELESPDIRAGMALVLAALVAEGDSVIHKTELIERGYPDVVENLKSLGANIQQIED